LVERLSLVRNGKKSRKSVCLPECLPFRTLMGED